MHHQAGFSISPEDSDGWLWLGPSPPWWVSNRLPNDLFHKQHRCSTKASTGLMNLSMIYSVCFLYAALSRVKKNPAHSVIWHDFLNKQGFRQLTLFHQPVSFCAHVPQCSLLSPSFLKTWKSWCSGNATDVGVPVITLLKMQGATVILAEIHSERTSCGCFSSPTVQSERAVKYRQFCPSVSNKWSNIIDKGSLKTRENTSPNAQLGRLLLDANIYLTSE